MRAIHILLGAALLLPAACTENTRTPGPGGNGGSSDANTPSDATSAGDGSAGGEAGVDAGAAMDGGALDAARPDRGVLDATVYPECAELAACCPELPGLLQNRCMTTSSGGDPAACTQDLNLAKGQGYCVPDAGGPPPDAGPLGPVCSAYLACCSEVPQLLQMICMNGAMRGDEARCQQGLDLAMRGGYCTGDAGVPAGDTGVPGGDGATDAMVTDTSSTADASAPDTSTALDGSSDASPDGSPDASSAPIDGGP